MSNDAEKTEWSLPGPADAPRDNLKLQLEVYGETILLRGFESDSTWVRTVSADEIANVFTQHLGLLLGAAAPGRPLVEPGRDRTGGCPLAATGDLVRGPATGGVQASRPAPASHAGAGLRLLAGPCALGLRRSERPAEPEQQLFRAPAFNVFRDGRVCPGSHRFPEDVGLIPESFFQSFFSLTGDTRNRSKKHPDNLIALWEEIDGTTAYPMEDLVPQCTVAHAMAVSEGRRGYRHR